MIYPYDAKEFSGVLDIVWQSLGRNAIDKNTKQYWFGKLQHLPMGTVSELFDKWLLSEKSLPTVNDILHMAKPKEFNKYLAAPVDFESNKQHANEIVEYVAKHVKPVNDYKEWARKIIANPSKYPDISFKYATEALASTGIV